MRYAVLSVLALACASCSSGVPPKVAASPSPSPEWPVITRLAGPRQVIVVRAGRDGPTYSVESKAGRVIVPARTLGDLAMANPKFFRMVRSMQANVLWAGL